MTCGLKEPVNTVGKPDKHPGGRPREHDRDQIAIDLIEWASKEDSINLCKFCALYKPPIAPTKMTLWAKECDKFREAYDTAKLFLGFRREEWLNQEHLHVKAYDLNASTYDYFLSEEKRIQAKFESMLKKEENIHNISPYQDTINLAHENMKLKAEIAKLKELNDNKS